MRVLLLEDDYLYKISIKEYLEDLEFTVDAFDNGDDAFDSLYENYYDLLLLDIRVPGMSGHEILKRIREDGKNTPVIIITSLTDTESLSIGFEFGCNDYLKKPFDLIELRYRIDNVIKSICFKSNEKVIDLKYDFSFDIEQKNLFKYDELVSLSQKEKEVISYLIQRRGFYVPIETLHENIWDLKEISYADIRMCIKRIRDKTSKEFVENKRYVGYRIDKG